MTSHLHQLVHDIVELTGDRLPSLMADGAPVLSEGAIATGDDGELYLIGLIGGKDIGKSALVNAVVGRDITPRTSWGPGTQSVIAYCHETQQDRLRKLLDEAVPGQYTIVTHLVPRLSRQVLLDLPDIDSHYESHIQITRKMLRHLLYPIWMQSVEKYADRRPQELLALVAAGNDPHNFIFCLNKVDQLAGREGEAAVPELRDDYAQRLATTLHLEQPPKVWAISALHPEQYDLPGLRAVISQQKTPETVVRSKQLAGRQQGVSLLAWIDRQDLPRRLAAFNRIQRDAEEQLAQRVGTPLAERVVPQLLDNPALRLSQADDLMNKRVTFWPIVNIIHVLLNPIATLVRRRLSLQVQRGLEGAEQLVEDHLRSVAGAASSAPGDSPTLPLGGHSVAAAVQSTFAYLQQSHPELTRLYARRKLWETMQAQAAEADLRTRLAATIEHQREVMNLRIAPRGGGITGLWRWTLTVGAVLWFPFLQPLLAAFLQGQRRELVVLAIQLLGVSHLLEVLTFLAIYFASVWLILKWDTQRRVDRALGRWKRADQLEASLSLTGQTMEWLTELAEPIQSARARLESLLQRSTTFRALLVDSVAA